MDLDELVRQKVIEKNAGKVRILPPEERLRRDTDPLLSGVRIDAHNFSWMIDAIHTTLYIADQDGMLAAKRFLEKSNLLDDLGYRDAIQALVNSIPRTLINGKWIFAEAGILDNLVIAFMPDIKLPSREEISAKTQVPTLFDESGIDLSVNIE